jgi:predicted DCC family thiol-disulfide oxidoreductase YuxK
MRLVETLDRNRRVTAVPSQKPGVCASARLTVEQCQASVWAAAPDGRRFRGAEAINVVLAVAIGTRFPHSLYKLPLVKGLQDLTYHWVANNRGKLPGDDPYCSQHPHQCR